MSRHSCDITRRSARGGRRCRRRRRGRSWIGRRIEGVAGDGNDVEILAVGTHPGLADPAAVADDANAFEVEGFFAVAKEGGK